MFHLALTPSPPFTCPLHLFVFLSKFSDNSPLSFLSLSFTLSPSHVDLSFPLSIPFLQLLLFYGFFPIYPNPPPPSLVEPNSGLLRIVPIRLSLGKEGRKQEEKDRVGR